MGEDASLAVMPPDSWRDQSPFGVLKTVRGERLVRLEDVHAWLMQSEGVPSASAVARVFGVFISDASSKLGMKDGAARVREFLYLTDLTGYAESVGGFAGRHFLTEVGALVPYVPHHRSDRGTLEALLYSLGLMAGEVWAPHGLEIDLNDRLDGYCAEGHFPTVAKSREILGRFAVPLAAAHALWGWGNVVPAAAASASAPAPLEHCEVTSAESLVRYREQFKDVLPIQRRPAWTPQQRKYLNEAVSLCGIAELAKRWGMTSEEAIRAQLRKGKAEAAQRLKPDAFAGLRERNRVA